MVNPGQNWHVQRIGALEAFLICPVDFLGICVDSSHLPEAEGTGGRSRAHEGDRGVAVRHNWAISPGTELQKRPLTCLEVEVL